MSALDIRIYGDPILRLKADKIGDFGDKWLPLIDDMYQTCELENGAGLAAPQIGKSIQLAVIYLNKADDEPLKMAIFNPEILETEGEESIEEGCLSIPGISEVVVRPQKIKVRYQDYNGEIKLINADGLLSRVLQHEIDHLHGVLFIDHLSSVKKMMLKGKLKDLAAGASKEG